MSSSNEFHKILTTLQGAASLCTDEETEAGWMGQAWGSLQVTEQQVKKLVHAPL